MIPRTQEQGAALLSVLLLVALMAVLATALLDRVGLATRLATNAAASQQLAAYARGAEAVAAVRIGDLAATNADQTTLSGGWLDRPTTIPLPGGQAVGRLRDGGNCFNVNSVVRAAEELALVSDPQGIDQFAALAVLSGIGAREAAGLAARLGDWLDSDSSPNPGGSEGAGADAIPPNTLLADPSELRTIPGMTAAIYARISPWLCALPAAGPSPLNVNTLTAGDAPLLAMLFGGRMTLAEARRIIAERPADGYGSLVRFWDQGPLAAMQPDGRVRAQPQLTTRWFTMTLDVRVGDAELEQTTLFDAQDRPVRVVRRAWGEPE